MALNKLKKQIQRQEKRRQRNNLRFGLMLGLAVLLGIATVVGGITYIRHRAGWEMSRAQEALASRDYDAALTHLRRVYRRDERSPQAPEAMYRTGRLLHRQRQQYREAILLFLQMEDRYPDSPFLIPALEETAEIYMLRLQDTGRAMGTYQRLVDLAPEDGDRYQYEVAEGYFQLGNFEQARIEFEQLLGRWPDSSRRPEVLLRIGLMYSLEGKLLQAEDRFRQLISTFADSSFSDEARIGLVGVYEERGELTTALDLLEEIAASRKDDPRIQQRLDQVRRRIQKKKGPGNH